MYAYLLSTGKIESWNNVGTKPSISEYFKLGCLFSSVILHEKCFTKEEFDELCFKVIQEHVPEIVELALIHEGRSFAFDYQISRSHNVHKQEVAAVLFNGLVTDYGFTIPEATCSFFIQHDTLIPMDVTRVIPASKSKTIMRAIKMWCHEYLTVKRNKELE